MAFLPLLIYILLCLITALYGMDRKLGFLGSLVLSFLLSPLLVLVILILSGPKRPKEEELTE